MTPEAQRIAIAEACGWQWDKGAGFPHPDVCLWARTFDSVCHRLPDYLNDLNAMREVEDSIAIFKRGFYNAALSKCAVNDRNLSSTIRDPDWIFQLLHASASQRAEAFLKTIGKWSD
jgi:hypothetical protein